MSCTKTKYDGTAHTRTKCSDWSITAWDDECLYLEAVRKGEKPFPPFMKSITGGLEECPDTKKIHFQGRVLTTSIYLSKWKSVFPKAHLEPTRKPEALEAYVMKEDTAVGDKTKKTNIKYCTMEEALMIMAEKVYSLYGDDYVDCLCEGLTHNNFNSYDYEYRQISSMVLADDGMMCLIHLYSQPQMLRAWKMYHRTIMKVYVKSLENVSTEIFSVDERTDV